MVNRLSPSELGLLAPLAKGMLQFVRENDTEAGDIFHGGALDVDDDEVHSSLSSLLEKQNAAGGSLDEASLKEILGGNTAEVWARCAHTLFMSAQPRLVPEKCFSGFASAGNSASKLRAIAEKMPNHGRLALAELCAMIKDSSMDSECTAMSIAASIMLPGCTGDKEKAKKAMTTLVEHNAEVFGNPGRSRAGSALVDSDQGPGEKDLSPEETRRRDALREFYSWRDPLCVPIVDKLFDNFDFLKIAQGLQQRYSSLPGEFVAELEVMALDPKEKAKLDWFKAGTKTVATKTKRFSLLPRINTRPSSRKSYRPAAIDRVIDEIVETEVKYQAVMQDLNDLYITKILDISEGKSGEKARTELGITFKEINDVFGSRLSSVLNVSNSLLALLSVVSVVPTPPKSNIGRAGLVAEVFSDHAVELRVYAPYISSHMGAVRILKKCLVKQEQIEKLSMSKSASKLLSSQASKKERASFDRLWNELSRGSPNLKGHTLASILINPVQRVPRYKLFLETLVKEVKKATPNGPAVALAENALEAVMAAAKQINFAVKQHNKLESFFGEDSMISPNNSIVKADDKGQYNTILNSYVQ